MKPFTDRQVQALQARDYHYDVFEGKGGGFCVRVMKSGRKSFCLLYRSPVDGTRRRLSLGVYDPPRFTLAAARKAYDAARADVASGIDPAAKREQTRQAAEREREAQRLEPTIAALLVEYWEREARHRKTGGELRRLLEKDVLPYWGKRKVKNITRRDAVELLDRIRDRAPITANRVHGRLVRLFNFAAERGIIEVNPLTAIRKPQEAPRERVLSDDEIAAFWHAMPATGVDWQTAAALQMILLTGQRPGEVSGMRWDELDPSGHWWTIPPARYKTGIEQVVPLGPLARRLLREARELAGKSAYVFPSPRPNGKDRPLQVHTLARALNRKFASLPATVAAGNSTAPLELVKRLSAARVEAFTPHDLRRTLRTRLAALGIDPLVAEKVLGHQLQGIARIYDRHDYAREKRAALLTWERHLYRLAGLVKPAPAKVIPIRRTGRTVARETA